MSLPKSFAQKFRFDNNVQDLRLDFSDSDEHNEEDEFDPAASTLADQGVGAETTAHNKVSPSKFKTVQSAKNQQIFNYGGNAGNVTPFGHLQTSTTENPSGLISTKSLQNRNFRHRKRLSALISPKLNPEHIQQSTQPNSQPLMSPSGASSGGFQTDEHTLFLTDLDFFEQEVIRFSQSYADSLMNRRQESGLILEDAEEELGEVYSEVQSLEQDMKKSLEMVQHLIRHSRDLFHQNQEKQVELDQVNHEYQVMINNNISSQAMIQRTEETFEQNRLERAALEQQIKELKEELLQKDEDMVQFTMKIGKQKMTKMSFSSGLASPTEKDIESHPKMVELTKKSQQQALDLAAFRKTNDQLQKDFEKYKRNYTLAYQELVTKQKECEELNGKNEQFTKYIQKVKGQRNEYKSAWDSVEVKLKEAKKQHRVVKGEMQRKIDELTEQIQMQLNQSEIFNRMNSSMVGGQAFSPEKTGKEALMNSLNPLNYSGRQIPAVSSTDYSPKDVEVVEIDDSNQGSGPPGRMYDEASRTGSGFQMGSGLNLGSAVMGSGGASGDRSGSGEQGDSFQMRQKSSEFGAEINELNELGDHSHFLQGHEASQIQNEQSFLQMSYSHDQDEVAGHLYDHDVSRNQIEAIQEGEEVRSRPSSHEGEDYEERRKSLASVSELGDLEARSSPSGSQYFHEVRPLALLQLLEEAPNVVTMEENISFFSIKVHEVEKPEACDTECQATPEMSSTEVQVEAEAQAPEAEKPEAFENELRNQPQVEVASVEVQTDEAIQELQPELPVLCQAETQTEFYQAEQKPDAIIDSPRLRIGIAQNEAEVIETVPLAVSLGASDLLGSPMKDQLLLSEEEEEPSKKAVTSNKLVQTSSTTEATSPQITNNIIIQTTNEVTAMSSEERAKHFERQVAELTGYLMQLKEEKITVLEKLDKKLTENKKLVEKVRKLRDRLYQDRTPIETPDKEVLSVSGQKSQISDSKSVLSQSKSKSKSKFKRFSVRNERPKPISVIREEEILTSHPEDEEEEDGPIEFKGYDEHPIHHSMNIGNGESPEIQLRNSANVQPTDKSILEVEANFEDDSQMDTLSLANRELKVPSPAPLKQPDSPRFPAKKPSPPRMAFSPKSQKYGSCSPQKTITNGLSQSSITRTSQGSTLRKDPNQEFFQMCLLSHKLNNQESEAVMELDHRELYIKCVEEEKQQFHQFNDWITKEVRKLTFKKMFKKNKLDFLRKKKLQKRFPEARDGILHVRKPKILDNYFEIFPDPSLLSEP